MVRVASVAVAPIPSPQKRKSLQDLRKSPFALCSGVQVGGADFLELGLIFGALVSGAGLIGGLVV